MIIIANMSGHVGKTREAYTDVHGGHGYGETNLESERLMETAQRLNLLFYCKHRC